MTDEEPTTETDDEQTVEPFHAAIEAGVLKDYFDPIDAVVDECILHTLADDGFVVRAMGPANVCMVDTDLPPEAFESYHGNDEALGIPLVDRFQPALSKIDDDEIVSLELDIVNGKLHVTADSLDFTMSLLAVEDMRDEPDIPDLNLPVEAVLEGSQLSTAVGAAELVSDHITFRYDPDPERLAFHAADDLDDVDYDFSSDQIIDLDGPVDTVESLFSAEYSGDLVGKIPSDAEVVMHLGTDFPTKMFYDRLGGDSSVMFMIAPRLS